MLLTESSTGLHEALLPLDLATKGALSRKDNWHFGHKGSPGWTKAMQVLEGQTWSSAAEGDLELPPARIPTCLPRLWP